MTAPIRSMPEVTMVQHMIAHLRIFARSRCRVKAWRLSDEQALILAAELSTGLWGGSPSVIYESMKRGQVRILGAKVIVR